MRNLFYNFSSLGQKHTTMKRYLFSIFVLIVSMAAVTACSSDTADNYCFYQIQTGIDKVTGPETIRVNEQLTLQATFTINNSCGTFNRFAVSNNYPKTIRAVVDYSGCTCQEIIKTETKPYIFKTSRAGTYTLYFVKPDGSYIIKTITVTQ